MNPLNRLKKLNGLPASELVGILKYKTSRSFRSLEQDLRVCLLRKLRRNARANTVSQLRDDIQFFGLDEWRDRKQELKLALVEDAGISLAGLRGKADSYCAHVFDLLGSGPVRLGDHIDWHQDFKSGARWEPKYFKQIKEIELGDASDIKVPWELSRCHHFVSLGIAYWLTEKEKYAAEFVSQCRDWIERNPPYHGVNWHCAMEVAIRAINWIWGYYLFAGSPQFDTQTRAAMACSLATHGEYIWNNLEFDKRVIEGRYVRHNGNHYISDLIGLIYLGLVLPGQDPNRWLRNGLEELDREMQVQVLSDGVHWELSPSYHRLVLELVLPAVILCSRNNIPVPQLIKQKCEAMLEYTKHYLKPDGLCPLVRDADDGRVYHLDDNDYRDHRHLLALGGAFFARGDFLGRAGRFSGEIIWMLGPIGLEKAKRLPVSNSPMTSHDFPEAGFYVLRGPDQAHIFVSCADIGMKGTYGGHAHNDCLSFELGYEGRSFITDCGTYAYSGDPASRNQFRSTASHNTARVDAVEINQFDEDVLFGMHSDAKPKVLEWRKEVDFDLLRAEHFGYTRLLEPVVHQRCFLLDRISKRFQIEDLFEGSGEHLFELFFHFSPGVELAQVADRSFEASVTGVTILLEFSDEGNWNVRLEEGWVSERYGRKRRGWTLVVASRQAVPAGLMTSIQLGVRRNGTSDDRALISEPIAMKESGKPV